MSAAATTQAPFSVHNSSPMASSSVRKASLGGGGATTSALEAHRNALRAGPTLSYSASSPCGSASSSPILGPLDRRRSSAREVVPISSSSLSKAAGSGMWRSGSASSSSSSSEYWRRPSLLLNSADLGVVRGFRDGQEDEEEEPGRLERRESEESAASMSSFDSNLWQPSRAAKGSRGSSISTGSSLVTTPGLDDLDIAPEEVAKMTPPPSPRATMSTKVIAAHHYCDPTQPASQRWPTSPTDFGFSPTSTDVDLLASSTQSLRFGHAGALGFVIPEIPPSSPSSLPGHSLHLPAAAIAARATTFVATRRRGTTGGPGLTFDSSWPSTSSPTLSSAVSTAAAATSSEDPSRRRGSVPAIPRTVGLRRPKTMASPQNHQGRTMAASNSLSAVDAAALVEADAELDDVGILDAVHQQSPFP